MIMNINIIWRMISMVKQSLNGVPETLLIPLWARAVETKKNNSIIKDYKALDMMESIDYDFSKILTITKIDGDGYIG